MTAGAQEECTRPFQKVLPLTSLATDPAKHATTRLVIFLAANALFGAGLFAHAFLYNFYLEALGLGAAVMGAAAAALTAGGLIALVPAGVLIDRVGARAGYLAACIIAATGLGLGGLATGRATLLASAVVAGAGTALWRVSSGPLIMQLAPDALRSRIFSWNVALLVGSGAAWVASAGAIPAWLERSLAVDPLTALRIVLVAGGILTGTAALAMLSIRVPHVPSSPGSRPVSRAHGLMSVRLVGAVAAVFVWMCASALVIPFFNIYFTRVHDLPVARVGVLVALAQAGTALFLVAGGELAARFGTHRTLIAWCVLFAPALGALALIQSVPLAIALFFLQGLVAPATNPLIDELLLRSAPPERHGIISSARNAATELSGFAAASAGGLLLEATSFATLFGTAALLAIGGACLLIIMLGRLHDTAPGHAPAQEPEHALGID